MIALHCVVDNLGCLPWADDFFANNFFIFIKKYMLQYVNADYYPLPPKTDG